MTPRVSVVIVTFNSGSVIRDCLQSLRQPVNNENPEVIVVDNMSSDGTAELVRTEFPEVALIEPGANLGYAGGNNLGVSASRGEHVLLLNPDTVLDPNAVSVLTGALVSDSSVWVVGPCIVDGNGNVSHAFGDSPTLWWAITEAGPGRRLGLRSSRVVSRVEECRTDRDVDFVTGASMMTTRVAWDRLGGFDEDYFLYFEDTDYCARIRRAGGRVRLIAEARVTHVDGASFGDAFSIRSLRSLQGLVLYLAKNSSVLAADIYRAVAILERLLYVLTSFLPGRRFSGIRRNRDVHLAAIRVLARRGLTRRVPRVL